MNTSSSMKITPERFERLVFCVAAVIGWISFVLFFRLMNPRQLIIVGIWCGPFVVMFTHYAFGGGIPRRLREKGWTRATVVTAVMMVSALLQPTPRIAPVSINTWGAAWLCSSR